MLREVAEKHRIRVNPIALDYGSMLTLKDGELKIDENELKRAMFGWKSGLDIVRDLPFMGLSEDESYLECEYCPGVTLSYYPPAHRAIQQERSVIKYNRIELCI